MMRAGAALLCALLLAGCGAAYRQPTAAPAGEAAVPVRAAVATGAVAPEQLRAAAWRLRAVGERDFPDSFAGVAVDDGRIVVYRKPDPGLDAALARQGQGLPLALRDAPLSRRQLRGLLHAVLRLRGHTRGYEIAAAAPDPAEGAVAVMVTGDLAGARRDLSALYGDRVEVVG